MSDRVREILVQSEVESYIKHIFPEVSYHPWAIPKSRGVDLDNQTISILDVTHMALNISNPALSQDCWLCMTLSTPMPLAIPVNSSLEPTYSSNSYNCSSSLPFRVQHIGFNFSLCLHGGF